MTADMMLEYLAGEFKGIKEIADRLEEHIYAVTVGRLERLLSAFHATESRKNGKDDYSHITRERLDYKTVLRELENFEDAKDCLRIDHYIERLKSEIRSYENMITVFCKSDKPCSASNLIPYVVPGWTVKEKGGEEK